MDVQKWNDTLLPDGVVQSPFRTTPNDPSPSLPYRQRSFSLTRHVKLWLVRPVEVNEVVSGDSVADFSCFVSKIYKLMQ